MFVKYGGRKSAVRVPKHLIQAIEIGAGICAGGAVYGVKSMADNDWKPIDSGLFRSLSQRGRYDPDMLRQDPGYVGALEGSEKAYPTRMVWGIPWGKVLPTKVDEIAADDPRRIACEAYRIDTRSTDEMIQSGAQGFAPFDVDDDVDGGSRRDINEHLEAGIGGINKQVSTGLVSWRVHSGGLRCSDGPENVKEMLASAGHQTLSCYWTEVGAQATFVAADSQGYWYRLCDNRREVVTTKEVSLSDVSQVEIFTVTPAGKVSESRTKILSPFKPTYLHMKDFSSECKESAFDAKSRPPAFLSGD